MTTSIPIEELPGLVERLRCRSIFGTSGARSGEFVNPDGPEAADTLESLAAEIERLGGDWFDKAIRDHEKEHGPSGGAWNISMILERLHSARKALSGGRQRIPPPMT